MFNHWRRVHRVAAGVLSVVAVIHVGFTAVAYERWSPGATWFLGTGLGLLLLGVMNFAHVGIEPCRLPTAPIIRWANWIAVAFALGAVLAVPQPQAIMVLTAIVLMAIAGHWTLLGTLRDQTRDAA